MKRTILLAAILTAIATTTITSATAQRSDNQMSIRVAGYEVLLEESRGTEDDRLQSQPIQRTKATPIAGQKAPARYRWSPPHFYSRQGIFEIGFNDFRTSAGTYVDYPAAENGFMDLNIARSYHIAGHVSTISQGLGSTRFGLTMALGFAYDQYFLETAVAFEKADRMLRPYQPDHRLQKSKMRTLTFHIPLLLEWQLSRRFFIAAGGYADALLWSDIKWKSPKEKLHTPYLNFLHAGLTARVGFGEWYFYGNYALTEMFKTGRGPVVSPYTVGVGFAMW